MSRARLVCWIALVAAIAALNYIARFSGTAAKHARRGLQLLGLRRRAHLLRALLGVVLAIAFDRTDLLALRRPATRAAGSRSACSSRSICGSSSSSRCRCAEPGKEQGLTPTHWEPAHAGAFAANVVLFTIVAPFVEELMFRGVGQSLLRFPGRWPSILLVGIAFGLSHGLVEALLVLVPFGIALAYLRDRTRSVYPGMVVHALFNGVALALAVLELV